jgi:hypothetical protein
MSREEFELIQEKRYELITVLTLRTTPKQIDEILVKINQIFTEAFRDEKMGTMTIAIQEYLDRMMLKLILDGQQIEERSKHPDTRIIH